MHSFSDLVEKFAKHFDIKHFPGEPSTLYEPGNYFLSLGGKRIRPVMCLMGNELFGEIEADAWHVGSAIELFHNFTLVHDDIMDKAPLRRGMATVHTKYGESTALLTGDVMLVAAYEYLNKVKSVYARRIVNLFNKTAREVCEGQQLDMDFEKMERVSLEAYLQMISLKTSVLLAASLQMGAMLGGAGEGNQQNIYEFGKNLGIAFQVQDDYLDAFGDPAKFGKQGGGDIMSNKKTFLAIHAMEVADEKDKRILKDLINDNSPGKIEKVIAIYKNCGVDKWAIDLKEKYVNAAMKHLEDIAVISARKEALNELAKFLVQRDY